VQKTYHVYIMAGARGILYTGMTSNLEQRVWQHRNGYFPGFSKKYAVNRLVLFEEFSDSHSATSREREIKGWLRRKKLALIKSNNPRFADLSRDWSG